MSISFSIPTNLSIAGTLAVGGAATIASTLILSSGAVTTSLLSLSGQLNVASTAASNSTSTGSATFGGGIGVAGAINAGGDIKNNRLTLRGDALEEYSTNGSAAVAVNYNGYAGGTTQFRNFDVYDGKNALVLRLSGADKGADFRGSITTTSYHDASGGIGTPVAGHAQYGGSGSYGASIIGNGSAYDFGLFNKSGTDVMHVATGGTTVAFSGAINAADDISIIGTAATDRTLKIQSLGAQYAQLKMNTNSSTANNFQVLVESGGRVYFQQNNGAINTLQIESTGHATYSKRWNVSDTTDSTSTTTGSIVTAGGIGVMKNLYVGRVIAR